MKLRVSFIEYLNSVPLGWSFLHGEHRKRFKVLFDVPAECARHLTTGEADIGLIPAIEYQRIPHLLILPDIAIASKREVKSVLFVSKLPIDQVSTVAVDTSSRTSVALLKILLAKFYKHSEATFHEEPPNPTRMLEAYDSALIIGNPALQVFRSNYHVYDLAKEWHQFTGSPFVFALWAVRQGVDLGEHLEIFYSSLRDGLEQIDRIAQLYSERLRITQEEVREYILKNLNYSLDTENLRGLRTFYDYAAELNLIEAVKPLQFYPQPSD